MVYISRMTIAFFGLSGLDVLGRLDSIVSAKRKQEMVNWVYAQQILPSQDSGMDMCGFRGSSCRGAPYSEEEVYMDVIYCTSKTYVVFSPFIGFLNSGFFIRGEAKIFFFFFFFGGGKTLGTHLLKGEAPPPPPPQGNPVLPLHMIVISSIRGALWPLHSSTTPHTLP